MLKSNTTVIWDIVEISSEILADTYKIISLFWEMEMIWKTGDFSNSFCLLHI